MVQLRERSLTVLVCLEAFGIFVLAPLAARNGVPIVLLGVVALAVLSSALLVVSGSRRAAIALCLAAVVELLATLLRATHPSERSEGLDFAAALLFFATLSCVVGIAVFGPGRVTIHRVSGAIGIYLNIAVAFALGYRSINALVAGAFTGSGLGPPEHSIGSLVYFSFATLTTSGYGDIVPVEPLARSIANLEAVVGQLFPATILARLITLELENRREGG